MTDSQHGGAQGYRMVSWLQLGPPFGPPEGQEHTQTHPTLTAARKAGMHTACLNAAHWVRVYAPDGTLECHWRREDETGTRDNLWHDVGPEASRLKAAMDAEIRAEMYGSRPQPPRTDPTRDSEGSRAVADVLADFRPRKWVTPGLFDQAGDDPLAPGKTPN